MIAPQPGIMVASIAAATRRRIATHLRDAGALSADTAVAYTPGRMIERRQFEWMKKRGLVHEGAAGLWYLDEAAWSDDTARRRKRIGIAMIAGAAIAAALAALA